ncbi:hypothetical protein DPEC_G00137790 [Dallia pectoralis]|uniref:Uncharacterized protein n=1 Tax=Dallia pectoralis TaxID=75939 RepID=A0ACC2GLQ6_DALPE|nr:hypothetical protein DPEC_G00137790 [Dallia pectoralis]
MRFVRSYYNSVEELLYAGKRALMVLFVSKPVALWIQEGSGLPVVGHNVLFAEISLPISRCPPLSFLSLSTSRNELKNEQPRSKKKREKHASLTVASVFGVQASGYRLGEDVVRLVAMEMSLNGASSHHRPPARLSWLLWALWVLLPTASPATRTLLFESGTNHNSLRNCSCPTHIQDCDVPLANIQCVCRDVSRSQLSPGGLREEGALTVWFTNPWILSELLNGSLVADLHLSSCGDAPVTIPDRYLVVFGLRQLRVHSAALGATHTEQALTIASGVWDMGGPATPVPTTDSSSSSSVLRVSFLDVSVLNGLSSLKAYSVSAPPYRTLSQHFPHLPLPQDPSTSQAPSTPQDSSNPQDLQQNALVTFIY